MINTILLLLVSLLISCTLSFFYYFYKNSNKSKLYYTLFALRLSTFFGILALLINPLINKKSIELIKTPLALVIDNSSSLTFLNQTETANNLYKKIISNTDIQEKFDIQSYKFDSNFEPSEHFNFKGTQTNLDEIGKGLKNNFRNSNYAAIIVTDGNQTLGNDYVFSFDERNPIYPIILGDTVKVTDLKINQLNVNKYAFEKNKFPVEAFLQYNGTKNINAEFTITQGNTILNKKTINFSNTNKTATVNLVLPANKVGLNTYKANLTSKEKEKNSFNNIKNFAVEIINQSTKIALISSINHPDLGALKRAIESNQQRKITTIKPQDVKSLLDYDLLILYQPTTSFQTIFESNKYAKRNTFIITGNNTDFNFLNQQQTIFNFKIGGQKEDYLAQFNPQFNLFSSENIGFENLPPLQNPFGTITTTGNIDILLTSKIRNIDTQLPLLAFSENMGNRNAYLFGENSWKWRLENHVNNKSFEKYDIFINKIIQYLTTNKSKKSLVVSNENFYNSGESIEITAQYFNKNYEFDENASLSITVTNTKTKINKNYDLLKSNNNFKVNLSGLPSGNYTFTVKELNSKESHLGHFQILDFDIEKQFVNPDSDKLKQLATHTQGAVFYPNQADILIKKLLENNQYKPVQKTNIQKTHFIDWTTILILLLIFLSTEWFLRKYNGLL